MAQASSGKVLREARERKGYDLNTVARRLRIRPDILKAIEQGDFASMPPRGYTRNMVNAYAKLLGLNPTEIVNLYLDEAYAEQVEKARDSGPSSGFNMQRETRRSRSQLGVGEGSGAETRAIHPVDSSRDGTRQFSRILYDDGTRFSRDDYGVTRQRTERPGKSDRDFLSHHSGYDATSTGLSSTSSPRRGRRNIYAGQTPMSYSASRLPSFLQSRTALIVLGVAILAIIIVVLVVVIGGRGKPAEQDVSSLPVSGINDTTGAESSSAASKVEVAPTSARVVYSVKSGEECYVEIYSDGTMTAENLTGPTEKTVDVTGTWTITTWSPEMLTVTVDGKKAELKASSQYGGMYALTVNFADILKQWNATHNGNASGTSTTNSTSTTGSNTTNSTTTGGTTSVNAQSDGTNYDNSNLLQDQQNQQNQQDEMTDQEQLDQTEENADEWTDQTYGEDGTEYAGDGTEAYAEGDANEGQV